MMDPQSAPEPSTPSSAEEQVGDPARRSFLRRTGIAALAAGAAALPQVQAAPANRLQRQGSFDDLTHHPTSAAAASTAEYELEPEAQLPSLKQRVLALKGLLIQKGVLSEEKISGFVAYYEKLIGPHLGAAAVAHAWVNPEFRAKLLNPPSDQPLLASAALRDFFFNTINPETGRPFLAPELTLGTAIGPEGEFLRIHENGLQTIGADKGKRIHNIVACTVCSCYPQALLGVQPTWYKSQQYRSRVITSPLGVVDEFMHDLVGTNKSQQAFYQNYREQLDEIRTWDSNSEVRFFVIPEMPTAWKDLPEHELRKRVTRNSMLGAEILLP